MNWKVYSSGAARGGRLALWAAWLGLCVVLADSAHPDQTQQSPLAAPVDRDTAQLLRTWMADQPVTDTASRHDPHLRVDRLTGDWMHYSRILRDEDAHQREKSLRKLYKRTDSEPLRGVILLTITEDPAYQSRQAQFVRRYGFYANWFNRVTHVAGRTLQGNVQSILGLGVDAVFDVFRPKSASAVERRALDKELQARAAASGASLDSDDFRQLETRVMRAQAETDLAQAEWSLASGAPDASAFYARQASLAQPDWKKARRALEEAEAAQAARRRRAIASRQAGYPDRQPPIQLAAPEQLAALLAIPSSNNMSFRLPDAPLIDEIAHALPAPGEGRSGRLAAWADALDHHPKAPENERLWVAAMVDSPLINPDRRLAQAQWRRRGQLTRYIFWGPESRRQQARRYAKGISQMINALETIGFFYVFEVGGRAIQVAAASPAPEEAILDAQATWLAECDALQSKKAQDIAEDLVRVYMDQGRWGDARRRLQSSGLWDDDQAARLSKAEARTLMEAGRGLPDGKQRTAMLECVQSLAPQSRLARKAGKELKRAEVVDAREIQVDWDICLAWARQPAPAGLPGDPAWFDRRLGNGEVSREGLFIKQDQPHSETYRVSYAVMYPGERRIHTGEIDKQSLDAQLVDWIELAFSQQEASQEAIDRLDRFPLAFELEGSAGLSSVDLSPKILPLSADKNQNMLYH